MDFRVLTVAFAALTLLVAPESVSAGGADAKTAKPVESKASKTCYSATPSGSRMPRKVCITTPAKADEKTEQSPKADAKPQ